MENKDDIVLRVSNLSVKIQGEMLLDDISFEAKRGATISVVGPNGAGKSMLFKALLNLIPYSGRIEWGEKVKIGYVPQHIAISDIPITVREFLSFKNSLNAADYLWSVELNSKEISDKLLGILSGGELQRVLIAWAIIDEPTVLLFDEPTSGVDIGSEEIVYDMLSKLQRKNNITMFLITHDLHVIEKYSDFILALNKRLIFFGNSKEITKPSLLNVIYGGSSVLFDKSTTK